MNSPHGCMARGGHAIPNVWLGPAMPYLSTSCGRPPLERPYGHFRDGRPQREQPAAILYPLGHPTPYASSLTPLLIAALRPICQRRSQIPPAREESRDPYGSGRPEGQSRQSGRMVAEDGSQSRNVVAQYGSHTYWRFSLSLNTGR
jgi:hypothetical protein